jgi:predicted ATPase/signal transduction histidine kinase/CheY-like chemotaxis protein/HPt (histidine-containing phosphotransfer) domain-containing protein
MILNGYNIKENIYSDSIKNIYKAEKDGKNVVIKILEGIEASEEKIKEIEYEFELLKIVDGKGAVKAIEILKNNLNYAVVFEWFNGKKMYEIEFEKLTIEKKLNLLYSAFNSLEEIHNKEIIHQNINPTTILWNIDKEEIKFIEFGNATILSKDKIIIHKRNIKDKEVNYISPEQTGRTNRSIDYRTDYYSIGAVFYEVFSGEKLFKEADSATEVIYRHVAKEPKSLNKINYKIHETVSEIIGKLLSKNCEDRYQSTEGVKYDIKKCIDMLKIEGKIMKFIIGENDKREILKIDEIESSRESEKIVIEKTYNNVSSGKFEILTICGKNGTGKSGLIKDIENEAIKRCGRVAVGKFDKYKKNIPYHGVKEAFKVVIKQIMSDSEENINKIKESILKGIGENGKVITELFPEMEYIIGKQSELEKLSPRENQNRFNFTFINFLNSISNIENPLVLCFDNCNWADIASIEFLKKLSEIKNIEYLMLVLIYRDEETDEKDDNFNKVIAELEENHSGIIKLKIEPLSEEEVEVFLKKVFQCGIERIELLSKNIYKITEGITLYIKQYIEIMYKRKIIFFDKKDNIWKWNENEFISLDIGKDISNLILNKIRECSKNCEILLRRAAIIGRNFDYKKITKLTGFDNEKTTAALWEAMQEKIIEPIEFDDKNKKIETENPQFKFSNDKFYQVLYSNIEEKLKKAIHEKLGRLILEDGNIEENIFEILYHLNLSRDSINEKKKLKELSQLNFKAGNKAKKSSAFKEALKYYFIADELINIQEEIEDKNYIRELYIEAAEAAYSCAEYKTMEKFVEYIINEKIDVVEKTNVYVVKILALLANGNSKAAVEFAIEKLREYGVYISKDIKQKGIILKIIELKSKLYFKDINSFSNLPQMNDKKVKAAMRILTTVSSSAYLSYPEVFILIVLKQVELSVKYGNSIESPFAYCMYGLLLCGIFENIEKGYLYGKTAMKILEKFEKNEYTGKNRTVGNLFVLHWKDNSDVVINNFKIANKEAMEFGDVEYAAWALLCKSIHSFFAGHNLQILIKELMDDAEIIKQEYKQEKQHDTIISFIEMIKEFTNIEEENSEKESNEEEEKIKKYISLGDNNGLYYLYSKNMILSLFFKEYQKGIEYSEKASNNMMNVISTINYPEYYFYSALCYINEYKNLTSKDKKIFYKMYKKLKKYAKYNKNVHGYKECILTAEIKRLKKDRDAINYYEAALSASVENGYIHDGALISELTAKYFKENKMNKLEEYYIEYAYDLYNKWGAYKKCEKIKKEYPNIFKNIQIEEDNNKNTMEMVDTIGLIKISQLLSKEVKYEKLVSKIIEVVMENAGAEKCKIFIKDREELVLEAETDINKNKNSNIGKKYSEVKEESAESIINYVFRTGESILINDASSDREYAEDSYIKRVKPKSILCIPIIVQNKTIGIMYFENNLTTGAFMNERVETLKIIASQSAISLENIRMYEKLEEKVNERTEELTQINKKLELKNIELEEAKNTANKAAQIKADFLANMSHEIRTPMNGIIGLTHLIKKTKLNQQQDNYVIKIEESAKHLLGIINDILDFSKLEAGKIKIEYERFSIENVLSYTSSVIMKMCEDKGVELFFKLNSKIPSWLMGDEMRLKQVLINLAGNAAKFTQHGEILVSGDIESEDNEKIKLIFTVKDTGIGMSGEEKKKLFQAFSQADSSISRKFGGTGLGLIISKNLIEIMGGKIWFESEAGSGSSFYFNVELKKDKSNEKIEESKITLDNKKILIIDDSEISLEILEEYLENIGVKTEKAMSGEEGIKKIKENKFDMIIIDWNMPELNGIDTIKKIRNEFSPNDIPSIIMVSAYNIDEIKEAGKNVGINGFLTKPVQKSNLTDTILKILNRAKLVGEVEEEEIEIFNFEKVLLVEDNKINQMVAVEFLNSFGLNTIVADNGKEALEIIKNENPVLILMDVQMPEMDGYQATKIIKFENGAIPIIAMTANSLDGDKEKCLSAGMDDYISKPINPEELNKKLSKWLVRKDGYKVKNTTFKFKGIDENIDIIKVAGIKVYIEIFKEFCKSYENIENILNEMYINKEEDKMKKYIHSLKSASSNIGANTISQFALKLENKLINNEDIKEEVKEIASEYKKILENIEK